MTEPPTRHPTPSQPLSEAGLARKAEILDLLHRTATARHARRRLARRTSLAAAAVAAGALAVRVWSPAPAPNPAGVPAPTVLAHKQPAVPSIDAIPTPPRPAPTPTAIPTATVVILTNDDVHLAACDSAGSPAPVPGACLLDDEQLLAALAETGETYGLIRAGDRVEVVRRAP